MKLLRDAGFKPSKVATDGQGKSIALGTIDSGELIIVAKTPLGEGYTSYNTAFEAIGAFNSLALRANLVIV